MASTCLSLHYHIVFGTKNREPTIESSWRPRLHQYLGGTISGLQGVPQAVGGVADHVHMLVGLKATHCLADFVREVKKSSSAFVHNEMGIRSFAWQQGYSAFTVSATARDSVSAYIADQERHHAGQSFHDELLGMLNRAGVEHDLRYFD